jgi:hypothetical protein
MTGFCGCTAKREALMVLCNARKSQLHFRRGRLVLRGPHICTTRVSGWVNACWFVMLVRGVGSRCWPERVTQSGPPSLARIPHQRQQTYHISPQSPRIFGRVHNRQVRPSALFLVISKPIFYPRYHGGTFEHINFVRWSRPSSAEGSATKFQEIHRVFLQLAPRPSFCSFPRTVPLRAEKSEKIGKYPSSF